MTGAKRHITGLSLNRQRLVTLTFIETLEKQVTASVSLVRQKDLMEITYLILIHIVFISQKFFTVLNMENNV